MQRQMLIAAGGGLASAFLSLGLLAGGSSLAIFAYFAALPLLAAGLWSGLRNAVIAGACAVAVLLLLGGPGAALGFAASIVMPSWIIVYHALSHRMYPNGATGWYSPGEIVARLSLLGALFVGFIVLLHAGGIEGIEASIRDLATRWLQPWIALLFPAMDSESSARLIDQLVEVLPALVAAHWLLNLVVNATIAQALLAKWGKAMRASPDYAAIEAPEWSSWALVVAAAVKLVSSGDLEYVAQNLVVILAAPFLFVGLAVVHTLLRRTRLAGPGLAVFYISLMIFTWLAVLVAALGFVEQWAKLRERFGQMPGGLTPRHQPEDE